jgi:hypothetical protein
MEEQAILQLKLEDIGNAISRLTIGCYYYGEAKNQFHWLLASYKDSE